jgi:hypothetical protein
MNGDEIKKNLHWDMIVDGACISKLIVISHKINFVWNLYYNDNCALKHIFN